VTERDHRTGPFKPGDRVQLTDPKKRQHTITLATGGQFHTHRGILSHDDLLGEPEGIVVKSTAGTPYLALRPLLSDYTLSMPRGAQVIYPKDAALIVGYADVFPGARVVEAGAGSGSLSCSLLRAVGLDGSVHSYELRPEFADVARGNVLRFFGEQHPSWTLTVGDVTDASDTDVDRVILDMLNPWDVLDTASRMLVPGGVICCYVATTTQLSRTVEALRAHGTFTEPWSMESLVRPWHVEGLAVRPDHRMVAHTAFLAFSRRLADGVEPPPVRRRPSKGMDV
jgi:tRNA (adenine57-N1/adenine58-N1)-methyltransferase